MHIRKASPKEPLARFSIYAQRRKRGISWRGGMWITFIIPNGKGQFTARRWRQHGNRKRQA